MKILFNVGLNFFWRNCILPYEECKSSSELASAKETALQLFNLIKPRFVCSTYPMPLQEVGDIGVYCMYIQHYDVWLSGCGE